VASVAADPSAIAPLPLPPRSDAAPPAGPSSPFADLLDAAAGTASQPQGGSSSHTDDESSAAQSGAIGTGGNGSSAGAAAAGIGTGKNTAANDPIDPATALDAGAATLDVTLVAGLLLPPVPLPASPHADQTSGAAQDPHGESADALPAVGGDAGDKPDDRKDASASSDPVAAGIIVAVPNVIPIAYAATVAGPGSDSISRVTSSPVTALPYDAIVSAPATGGSAAGTEATSSGASAQQTNQTAQPVLNRQATAPDGLAGPSIASAPPSTDGLQMAALPAALPAGAGDEASDLNARAAPAAVPAIAPAAPPTAFTPIAALAPLNPVLVKTASAEPHIADQLANNAGAPREAEDVSIPLPTQIAVRFAPPVHADNDTSDNGADARLGYAGHGAGGTTATINSSPATTIPPSFNAGLVQAVSAPAIPPSHAAVMPDAVPLAGIPIAIVARAEAGEKKFEIRLDPPDLGRIEVQLNVDSSGRATSHLIVDRADTLDLLRRDAPALERALQSAGLTTGDGALQFSLRDQSFAGRDQGLPTPVTPAVPAPAADSDPAPIDTALRRYGPPLGLGGGIDIRV
jgi:flagellar hook-length control protein FliK